jgi:hypothetical protein
VARQRPDSGRHRKATLKPPGAPLRPFEAVSGSGEALQTRAAPGGCSRELDGA